MDRRLLEAKAAELNANGITVIPLLSPDELRSYRQLYIDSMSKFPEYTKKAIDRLIPQLHADMRAGVGKKKDPLDRWVGGGFAALANPSSFHNPATRKLRLRVMFAAVPMFSHLDQLQGQSRNLEQLFDRMMVRPAGEQAKPESWHRDVSVKALKHPHKYSKLVPQKTDPNKKSNQKFWDIDPSKEPDRVFGGWINLDPEGSEDQTFSHIPGTHEQPYTIKAPTNKKPRFCPQEQSGMVVIDEKERKTIERKMAVRMPVPPGHWIVFNQNIVHEVLATSRDTVQMRQFVGFRLTPSNKPLFNHSTAIAKQGVPLLPSGQKPIMWPDRVWNPVMISSTVKWAENTFVDAVMQQRLMMVTVKGKEKEKEKEKDDDDDSPSPFSDEKGEKKKEVEVKSKCPKKMVQRCFKKVSTEKDAQKDWPKNYDCFAASRKELRSYQREVAETMMRDEVERFTVLHPPGSGKTVTASLTAECLLYQSWKREGKNRRVIVLAPAGLLKNFCDELSTTFNRSEDYIRRRYCFFSPQTASNNWREFVKAAKDNILIVDEVHLLAKLISTKQKTGGGKEKIEWLDQGPVTAGVQSAAFLLAAREAWKVLAMTGTLLANRADGIYNIVQMHMKGPPNEPPIERKVLENLKSNSDFSILREFDPAMKCRVSWVKESEIKENMPSYNEHVILIEMSAKYYQKYMDVETDAIKSLAQSGNKKKDSSGPGPFYVYVRQATGELVGLENQKRAYVLNLLAKGAYPMVIVTEYIEKALKPLKNALVKAGYSPVVISGEVAVDKRKEAQDQYNSGKANIIILSKSGNTGVNLPNTKVVVLFDQLFTDSGKMQSLHRGVRMGGKYKVVEVYNLFLAKPNDIEPYVKKIEQEIEDGLPGAPTDVTVVRPPAAERFVPARKNTKEGERKGKEKPAVDLALYDFQREKAIVSNTIDDEHVIRWSTRHARCFPRPASSSNGF